MEIRYVNTSIANNFGSYIEINSNLRAYPELHDAILKHEISHTNNPKFNREDFMLDLGPTSVNYWKLFVFMCTFPKSFLQFAPIYKRGKDFVYDSNMIVAWTCFFGVIGISLFLALH